MRTWLNQLIENQKIISQESQLLRKFYQIQFQSKSLIGNDNEKNST